MKKKILVLLVLTLLNMIAICSIVSAKELKIDAKTFPDGYIRTILSWNADINNDGILQQEEIDKVTALYITKDYDQGEWGHYGEEIEWFARVNCKGLENFTNLKRLDIRLGEYYDSGKYFGGCCRIYNIDRILKLKKLQKLTLSGDEKLRKLDLSGLSKLEQINLENMDNLQTLKMNNRKLKKYEQMGCEKLKVADFSKLKGLKSIELRNVYLKNLKFGKKNKNLKTLLILGDYNRKIKTLKKLELSTLSGLELLHVSDVDSIKKINLEQNKKIIAILCYNNKKLATVVLPKKNRIKTIWLSDDKIKKFDTSRVNNKSIKEIDLKNNPLKSVDITHLKKLKMIQVTKNTEVIKAKGQKTEVRRLKLNNTY